VRRIVRAAPAGCQRAGRRGPGAQGPVLGHLRTVSAQAEVPCERAWFGGAATLGGVLCQRAWWHGAALGSAPGSSSRAGSGVCRSR